MRKIRYRVQVWRQIKGFINGVKIYFWGDMVTEILVRVMNLLFPILYGVLLEQVILGGQGDVLWLVIAGYLLLQVLKSGLLILQRVCQNRVSRELTCELKTHLLQKYLSIPINDYFGLSSGNIKMTLEDGVDKLADFPSVNFRYWLNMLYLFGIALVLLRIDGILTLVALLSIPVTFFLDHMVSHNEKGVNEILNKNDASWATWLDEMIHQWRETRIYQCETIRRAEFGKFQNTDEKYFSSWLRFWVTRVLVIPKIKDDFFMQFLMYFLGGIMIYHHQMTIGVLLVFIQYFGILSEQVKAVSAEDANLQSQMVHYERVMDRLQETETVKPEGLIDIQDYDITLDKVTFGYKKDEELLLKDFNLQISQGERVGIVGESGSGKSTLLKLMLGILEPLDGEIRYGKLKMQGVDKESLYRNTAYISQESRLYNDSVLENLKLVREDATGEEIEEACRQGGILEVIRELPEGFDTVIGENGSIFSGGQRQRLILAKAFLKDPKIFLFDEATSALDHQTEEMVNENIERISLDKTVILVAHKENSFRVCDRLVRL